MLMDYVNKTFGRWADGGVVVLSVALVVAISCDAFGDDSGVWTKVEAWVCLGFVADFFVGLAVAENRRRYARRRWAFLALSIPYGAVLGWLGVDVPGMYLLRFMPLCRGVLALSVLISYLSRSKIGGVFYSYLVVLVAWIYFGSLIIYEYESPVNPGIPDYQTSLWWVCMDAATIGSGVDPVTVVGKVVAVLLAVMGMTLFPLLTVYLIESMGWLKRKS